MAFNPWSCGKCIAKISTRIAGYDPRSMVKQCAWECLKAGKGGRAFKRCMKKKLETVLHDVTHAEQVANDLWNNIKGKCS